MDLGVALRRLGDAGEHLEQRGLPRPVTANDAHHFTALDPSTSSGQASKETSFSAQMVSLERADD